MEIAQAADVLLKMTFSPFLIVLLVKHSISVDFFSGLETVLVSHNLNLWIPRIHAIIHITRCKRCKYIRTTGSYSLMEVNEALPGCKRYTYADYCAWDDEKRWELIDGIPRFMAPPSRVHQEIIGNLHYQLYNAIKGKSCKVYIAPFDVRLSTETRDDTVVQPDLLVVCDKSKLDDRGCVGAPDLVVEVLSPSTVALDTMVKFRRYLQAGVSEYWTVDPDYKIVSKFILKNGEYVAENYGCGDSAPVHVLEGCAIELKEVFSE